MATRHLPPFRVPRHASDLHKILGIQKDHSKKVFGGTFSPWDFDRVVQWSNGNTTVALTAEKLGRWFLGVGRLYEARFHRPLRWQEVFDDGGLYAPSPDGPSVAYIQMYSGALVYQQLADTVKAMSRHLGWQLEFRSGDGEIPTQLAHIRAAMDSKQHILVDLPFKETLRDLNKAVGKGLRVVASGSDATGVSFLRVNVNNYEMGLKLGRAVKATARKAKVVVFGAPDRIYPHNHRVQGIEDELGKVDYVPLLDHPENYPKFLAEIQSRSRCSQPLAVVGVSRGTSAVLLLTLDRLNWPENISLFSTDLTPDWLHRFARQERWRAIGGFEPLVVAEVSCRLLNCAIHDAARIPSHTAQFEVQPFIVTRADLGKRRDWDCRELIAPRVREIRSKIVEDMPWLGFTTASPVEG